MAEATENKKHEGKDQWWQQLDKLSPLKLGFVTVLILLVTMALAAIVLLATPLREYLPGYTDKSKMEREVYALHRRTDSIERELYRKDIYFKNLKMVIEGYDFTGDSVEQRDIYAPLLGFDIDTVEIRKSVQDSALRAEFEEVNLYNLRMKSNLIKNTHSYGVNNFFTPLAGTVIHDYDPDNGHYGIDIAAPENQVIKAVLDGTVIVASWTFDFGYTLGIQHENNYFSTYKHNAVLLKKEGDFVKAGEAIAILGESGEAISEPQLHFELWHNGMSLNPQDYINFKTEN